jgi:hypothetical protein
LAIGSSEPTGRQTVLLALRRAAPAGCAAGSRNGSRRIGSMNFVAPTATRVTEHTAAQVNRQIERQIEASVAYFAEHPDEIAGRLEELDREWDIERTLEANAASFSLLGLTLALTVDRRWLALPIGVAAFLLQHAVQGWCPPVPVFRRLGVRTADEIDRERYALKALRGDFDGLTAAGNGNGNALARAEHALAAARTSAP